jgi:hypothetical protein
MLVVGDVAVPRQERDRAVPGVQARLMANGLTVSEAAVRLRIRQDDALPGAFDWAG